VRSSPVTTLRGVLVAALVLAGCRVELPVMKAGVDAFEAGQFADASNAFDRALAEAPSSEAHLGKASALHQLGKFDEAAEDFRRALSSPDEALRARAYFDLGVSQARGGKLDDAIESFRRSLQLVPDDPDARYDLEWALAAKRQQEQQKKDGDQSKGGDGSNDKKSDEKKQDGDKSEEKKSDEQKSQDKNTSGQGDQGSQGEQGQDATPPQGEGGPQPDEKPGAGTPADERREQPPAKPMNAQKAGAVLDALQGGEKSLQMWRFQDKGRRKGGDVDQDW